MNTFSQIITRWRIENGYTQEKIADICNISVRTIQSWEKGKRLPGFDSLILMADTMNVSIDYLCGRTNIWKTSEFILNEHNII